MKKVTLSLVFLMSLVVFMGGCTKKNRFAIDDNVEHIGVEIQRFDKDLISIDTADVKQGVDRLYALYPEFFPLYIENILELDARDTTDVVSMIRQFVTDTSYFSVNKRVLERFDNVKDIESHISTAYTYMRHYFREIPTPDVYFFVSGYNLSIMIDDKVSAMGTDLYLGPDYDYYYELTYEYVARNMNRDNLAPDMISAMLFRHFPMDTDNDRLIDHMLHRGKVMYLLSVFMPKVKEEYLMGYTKEQVEWCHRYEKEIWGSIIDKKHLFSTDGFLIRKYMNEAPFTSPVSQDSPGRLGTWVGMRIVESYMDRNTDVSLRDLMETSDYEKILRDSGYRP